MENDYSGYTAKEKAFEEGAKLHFDALKHIATLNSAGILVSLTLVEKIFPNASVKSMLVAAIGCFISSIVLSGLAMMLVTAAVRDFESSVCHKFTSRYFVSAMLTLLCFLAFVSGIVFLSKFVFDN